MKQHTAGDLDICSVYQFKDLDFLCHVLFVSELWYELLNT